MNRCHGRMGLRAALALTMGLLGNALHAQIHAHPSAPGAHQPTVLLAPGGVPLVNITTPSAAGVSRNIYRQFDVGTPGAILNNSRSGATTRLGGRVAGNPWLASGPARVILNEVRSAHPSHLNGWIEVAGQRAEVIVAIRRVESGEAELIEADGNAWVAHITRDKVWFEGLYNQGEGGEVSFGQYKLAVETYVRFLTDPERKTIEVAFPAGPLPGACSRAAETTRPTLQVSSTPEESTVNHRLVCHLRVDLGGRRGLSRRIDVIDAVGRVVARFDLMCAAIDEDIQSAKGSGATALEEIRRIESGEAELIEADGNAWVTHITRDRVWFEGLYSQGEGGEVSFAQYKLAVETFVRFLADPERQPVEVAFPAD